MASPQLENGYTRIANEILDALISAKFPGQELRLILAVIRKTYGFGKKEDRISFGQLSQLTGIPRREVIRLFHSLVGKNTLGSGKGTTRQPRIMWFNKDFSQWLPSGKGPTSGVQPTIPSGKEPTITSGVQPTHKRKKEIKERIYMEPHLGEFKNVKLTEDEFWKLRIKFGEPEADRRIQNLSEYIASKGKRYQNHYATILTWARKDGWKDGNKSNGGVDDNLFLRTVREENEREAARRMGKRPGEIPGPGDSTSGTEGNRGM